jgi:hypothetical protein
MFDADDLMIGSDFDECLDEHGEFISDHPAAKWLSQLDSYSEISPSRMGIKVWTHAWHDLGGKSGRRNAKKGVEIYRERRFFALTGERLTQFSGNVEYRQTIINGLYSEIFDAKEPAACKPLTPGTSRLTDADVINRASDVKSGDKFKALWSGDISGYGSMSEGDLALTSLLWSATDDREAVRRLFGQSALGQRKKWHRKDYQDRTLDLACNGRHPGSKSAANVQPLADYVMLALKRNWANFAARSKWRSPLFHFVRLLKGRLELQGCDGIEAAATIDPVLRALANGNDSPWEHHFGDLHADPRAEFCNVWEDVKTPALDNPLESAYFESNLLPLIPIKAVSPLYGRFVSVAGHTQRLMPDKNFLLPVAILAEMLGCDRTMVSTYIRIAKKAGILREVGGWSYAERKAKEYRFALQNWDWTTGKQIAESEKEAERIVLSHQVHLEHQDQYDHRRGGGGTPANAHRDECPTPHQGHQVPVVNDVPDEPDVNDQEAGTESLAGNRDSAVPVSADRNGAVPASKHDAFSAGEALITKARARGEEHGFTGTKDRKKTLGLGEVSTNWESAPCEPWSMKDLREEYRAAELSVDDESPNDWEGATGPNQKLPGTPDSAKRS